MTYALDHLDCPTLLLVHGELQIPLSVPHAWVEVPGGVVFDGTMQRFYRLPCYRSRLGATVVWSYGADEAMREWAHRGHYGPWY